MADGEARPQGPDQLPFGAPPAVGDALYLGFEEPLGAAADPGRRRRLAGPRRGRRPRGPAAALGGLAGRRPLGRGDRARRPDRRLQLRRRHGRARAAAALGDPADRRPPPALAALPDRRQDAPRRRRDDVLAPARDLLDHRRAGRRPAAGVARRARGARGRSARPTARPARCTRCATARCSSRWPARRSRCRTPSRGDWATWELREDFAGSTELDRHFALDLVDRHRRARAGDPRDATAAGPSTAPCRRKGAVLRFTRYRHGGGRTGQRHGRHADRAQERDPRRRHRHQPGAGDRRRRRRARSSTRAQRASMEIRSRYRAVTAEDFEFLAGEASPRVARAVCIAARRRRAGAAAPAPARVSRRPAARARRAAARRGR